MKALEWIIIGVVVLTLLIAPGLFCFIADNRAYPENDTLVSKSDTTMYFNIVFENDTVIHKPL